MVTKMAQVARRVLSGTADRHEAEDLLRRIARLEEALRDSPSAPISVWLANLKQQVEKA